jgi:hypothetical protein
MKQYLNPQPSKSLRLHTVSALMAIAVLATACGGGGSDAPATSTTTTTTTTTTTIVTTTALATNPVPLTTSYVGNYSGAFSGTETGTFTMVISSTGRITVDGFSQTLKYGLILFGQVEPNGAMAFNGVGPTVSYIFSGDISPVGAFTGTWKYGSAPNAAGGTFTGQRN